MSELSPRQPQRPLFWPDIIFQLKEFLAETKDEIYIVGGAVRDALLHRPLKDIDLATSGDGLKLARRIANHFDGDFFALDSERDVGRALVDTPDGRLMFDVARFRGEGLLNDLRDRDFTLNAMAVDTHGDLSLLIDPLNGESDIGVRTVRRCTPYALASDPIRVMRAIRQSLQLGMRIEPETLADIRQVSPQLVNVSPERLRDEWFKLLALPKPAAMLRVADVIGVLKFVLPEVDALHGVKQSLPHVRDAWEHTLAVVDDVSNILSVLDYHRSDNLTSSFSMGSMAVQLDGFRAHVRTHMETQWPNERSHRALLVFAAILHDVGKLATANQDEAGEWRFLEHEQVGAYMADERATALRLSNAEREWLVAIVRNHMRPLLLEALTPRTIYRFWKQTGAAGVDICLLSLADYLGTRAEHLNQGDWLKFVEKIRILLEAYFERYDKLVEPPTLVDGNQLMRILNLKPGRVIGELLELIKESQAAGEVQTMDDALQLARKYLDDKPATN
ncbi:MAG: HD domain-containing protein [Chloroflexota bacterium]